jgi:hypothetical protein
MFAMEGPMRFPSLLFLSFAATLAAIPALAQQPPDTARPAYDGSASPDAVKQIFIDQNCRILPGGNPVLPGKKDKPFGDPVICHLESILNSNHVEEKIVGNELYRSRVYVAEQEFVLQNITEGEAEFIVEVPVNSDWVIDSDPQPASIESDIAVFPVYAQPGEIVRLHVGMRHTKPLKTREINK